MYLPYSALSELFWEQSLPGLLSTFQCKVLPFVLHLSIAVSTHRSPFLIVLLIPSVLKSLSGLELDLVQRYLVPATEKRGGAWMDEVVGRSKLMALPGEDIRLPVAHMVCPALALCLGNLCCVADVEHIWNFGQLAASAVRYPPSHLLPELTCAWPCCFAASWPCCATFPCTAPLYRRFADDVVIETKHLHQEWICSGSYFFPSGLNAGSAWMMIDDGMQVCNQTPPVGDKPSLMTFR